MTKDKNLQPTVVMILILMMMVVMVVFTS